MCVESECGVRAESVCGMCVVCFGVVVCCAVSSCVVLVLVLVRNVWCVVSVCVCVVCVVCGVVCVVCVWLGLASGKPPCAGETSPSEGSKRIRVYQQKRPHVFNMRAFCQYTRKRFEPSHGDVFNLHTGRREGRWGEREGVLFSLFLSPSFSFSSLSLSLLLSLLSQQQ